MGYGGFLSLNPSLTWTSYPSAPRPLRPLGLCATNGRNGQVNGHRLENRIERPVETATW